jgi:hypothetical protein
MKIKVIFYLFIFTIHFVSNAQRAPKEKENPGERARFEYNRTKDPKTGLVPRDELEKARGIMAKMIKLMAPIPNVTWAERGPNTVGGRTRALMWDPNDNTKKKVWAGGVSGGLWYNNDITDANVSWTKVDDFWDNIAIGTIAYDPNNTQIMYVGTGERNSSGNVGNSGESGTGGGGIWKTTNGGTTWSRLNSTLPDYVNENEAAGWRTVEKIVVNAQGHVYALNYWGVSRSTDGGTTWAALSGTNTPPSENPNRITDIELGTDGILYVGEGGAFAPKIYKSTDASISAFTLVTPSHTATKGRVDILLAPNTSGSTQTLYAIAASSDAAGVRFFKKSVDAGANWTDITVPLDVDDSGSPKPPFTGKQGDYNLVLGIKPTDANTIYAGGTTVGISYSGGTGSPAWKHELGSNYFYPPSNKFFVDNHAFAARPGFPNEAIFGNDGGVFYSADWGDESVTSPNFQRRTKGYNVTQFYSVAIGGSANSGLVIGGAQDNGTQVVNSAYGTQGNGFEIRGGDGGLNYIDQEDVNLLISSYTNVTYQIHPNGPANSSGSINLTPTSSSRGEFINQSDYDSQNNTLYVNYYLAGTPNQPQIIRYTISGTAPNYTSVSSILTLNTDIKPSVIKLGKTAGSLFLGTSDGKVYKASGIPASGDQNVALTQIMDNANTSNGYVSSIDFGTTENTIVVVKSNYNIKSVFYSTDGGSNWTSKDEAGHGLPNVPIRYVLVNPVDTKQVLLATELGVWSSSDITATNPQWAPTNAALANVRCDMLRFRASDNTVAVATHGRGFFTTKINQNGTPCPTTLVLISTADDKATGTTSFQAAETISASNKITGNANVNMRAGKSIELKPSTTGGGTTFEASNGTVFYAYIQGCAN